MNLRQIVIQKVEELGGPAKATEFFGKSVQAIRLWTKNGAIPLDAIQRVIDSQGEDNPPEGPAGQVLATSAETAKTNAVLSGNPDRLTILQGQIDELRFTLSNIEY